MNDIFENYEWQIEVDDSNRIILKSNMQTMGMTFVTPTAEINMCR